MNTKFMYIKYKEYSNKIRTLQAKFDQCVDYLPDFFHLTGDCAEVYSRLKKIDDVADTLYGVVSNIPVFSKPYLKTKG